ncbi:MULTISPECIES: ParB/RepB/Spo0J family partition protein [Pseudomonas]|uniref:ParB/Spo0J HTH domain-containing protein n=1 Tax=Pseudomonas lutea TaxID=243924 RepID=A0A9X8MH33_9PSED|nr:MULTISPECIES: hypothetical protein [Pseudomonas]SER36464.1 hypothetical protein SAMN05216409_11853 [Pseudomonas lutea]
MSKHTIASLTRAGVIKRGDKGMHVELSALRLVENFNMREEGERLEKSIDELAEAIIDGIKRGKPLKLPNIEVEPNEFGTLDVVEGHRRTRAYRKVVAAGYDVGRIFIDEFKGSSAEKKARIASSNNQLPLLPIEQARLYASLRDEDGLNNQQIADLVFKKRQHVEQMLKLYDAGPEVMEQVSTGVISAATAVDLARKHGDDTAKVIRQEHAKAIKQGQQKVMPKTIKAGSVPKSLVDDLVAVAKRFASELPAEVLAQVQRYRSGEKALGDSTAQISIRTLNALVATALHVSDVKADKERQAEEKRQQAAQEAQSNDV